MQLDSRLGTASTMMTISSFVDGTGVGIDTEEDDQDPAQASSAVVLC